MRIRKYINKQGRKLPQIHSKRGKNLNSWLKKGQRESEKERERQRERKRKA